MDRPGQLWVRLGGQRSLLARPSWGIWSIPSQIWARRGRCCSSSGVDVGRLWARVNFGCFRCSRGRNWSDSGDFGRTMIDIDPTLAVSARYCPNLFEFGPGWGLRRPVVPKFGQHRPRIGAKFGRCRPELAGGCSGNRRLMPRPDPPDRAGTSKVGVSTKLSATPGGGAGAAGARPNPSSRRPLPSIFWATASRLHTHVTAAPPSDAQWSFRTTRPTSMYTEGQLAMASDSPARRIRAAAPCFTQTHACMLCCSDLVDFTPGGPSLADSGPNAADIGPNLMDSAALLADVDRHCPTCGRFQRKFGRTRLKLGRNRAKLGRTHPMNGPEPEDPRKFDARRW